MGLSLAQSREASRARHKSRTIHLATFFDGEGGKEEDEAFDHARRRGHPLAHPCIGFRGKMSKRRERPSVVSPRRPLLSFLPLSESAASASAAVRTQLQAKGRRESTAAADFFQVRRARRGDIHLCGTL